MTGLAQQVVTLRHGPLALNDELRLEAAGRPRGAGFFCTPEDPEDQRLHAAAGLPAGGISKSNFTALHPACTPVGP